MKAVAIRQLDFVATETLRDVLKIMKIITLKCNNTHLCKNNYFDLQFL